MKLLVCPTTDDLDSYIKNGASGFVLPLQDFSTDYQKSYSYQEIDAIRKKYQEIELFVVMNQMLLNDDLEIAKEALLKLESFHLSGIFFYDWGLFMLHQEAHLKTPLVWNQTHMVTNKESADFVYEKGVHLGVLSSEITLEEIKKILQSNMSFFLFLVGYMPVGVSRRKLISNFYQSLGKEGKHLLEVREENSEMPFFVMENEKDTSFLYGKCLNVAFFYETLSYLPISYGILKEDFLDHDVFLKVLSCYAHPKDFGRLAQETGDLIGRNTGFLARKTVFKVKK